MKIVKSISCVLMLIILLTSCGKKTDEQIITKNVTEFAKALYTSNFEKAAKYCTPTAAESIPLIQQNMPEEVIAASKKTKPSVEVSEVTIDEIGMTARVKCILRGTYDLNTASGISEDDITTSFILYKEGNKWLVN